jgi:prepilin-type N-terminal cleavage/methylation domain-containing protein
MTSAVLRCTVEPMRRAFTMFELIVTLVVLALLSGVAFAGFTSVVGRSQAGTTQATLSSYAFEAQSLWVADAERDWPLALTRAGRDLPSDEGWSVERTSEPSGDRREVVFLVDSSDPRRVGMAVGPSPSGPACFALIEGGSVPSVWCDDDEATAGEALRGEAFGAGGL